MGGGPISWSPASDYGIFGVIYEGCATSSGKSRGVYGEVATPAIMKGWIEQLLSWHAVAWSTALAAASNSCIQQEGLCLSAFHTR